MAATSLHVVFTEAIGNALREALGEGAPVVVLADDLATGPLDVVPREEHGEWTRSLAPTDRRIVWTDRRVARQYAGLMAWVARAGDTPFEVVDLTHAGLRPQDLPKAEDIPQLLAKAAPISTEARADLAEDWASLRVANAPVRVVREGQLASAPETVFDAAILRRCSPYWMRKALVMDAVLMDDVATGVLNLSPGFLAARMAALVAEGRLEAGGPASAMGPSEIRLSLAGQSST